MAKLPAVIESLDKVEEPFRGAYVEKEGGGGFVLDADIEAHPTVTGLKSTKDKLSKESKRLAEALKPFEGVDRARYDQLVKEADEREAAGEPKAPDAEKLRKKIEADLRKEYEPVTRERDELRGTLTKHQLFDVADKAAMEAGVLPDRLDDAQNAYSRYVRLNADKKVEVLDESGDPTGETLKEFFSGWFKEKKPWFYAGVGANGGGAEGNKGGGTGSVITLTAAQASDHAFVLEMLKKVGGDWTRLKFPGVAAPVA